MYICTTQTHNHTMSNLIEILKAETSSLKVQYIEMTQEWAKAEIQRLIELSDSPANHNTMKQAEWNQRALGSNLKHRPELHTQPFLDRIEKAAIAHYNNSIEKLAFRIEAKGLNIENIKTVTAHVGVNIETTLTDGIKTVRAFTIIAGGPIQRPHYRYLIK